MARARFAVLSAMLVILLLAAVPPRDVATFAGVSIAAVAWPPSSGLVVAEVVTGGASASDEYVEIANVSAGAGRPPGGRGGEPAGPRAAGPEKGGGGGGPLLRARGGPPPPPRPRGLAAAPARRLP